MFVVAPLLRRQHRIALHAHVGDVGGVARDPTDEAGRTRDGDENGEGGLLAIVALCEAGLDFFVDAESCCGVGDLSQKRGGETGVKAEEAVVFEDVLEGSEHRGGHGAAAHLETDLGAEEERVVRL